MPVTIRRDEWGVPHVDAASESDAFYAVGWAQAEDHLPLMMRVYRALAGGSGDSSWVRRGAYALRWQHLERARQAYDSQPAAVRIAMESFIRGVRAYAAEHPEDVPEWAPALEPALPLAVYRSTLWGFMVRDALDALAAAGVEVDPEVLAELAETTTGSASNAAYLSAARTATGAPVLLSDPHGTIDGLQVSEVRIRSTAIDAIGVCCVGSPLPMLGHTRGLAWAMTTGAPRVSDAVWFPLVAPDVCLVAGVEQRIQTRTMGTRHVEELTWSGVACPVVARDAERVWVVATPYAACAGDLDALLLGLLQSSSVKEAKAELAGLGMFPQNLLLVDREDHSFYLRAGKVPVRAGGVDPTKPIDGSDPANQWQGVHPLEDLVQHSDPACGWMQNDNVAPDAMYDGAALTSSPAYLFNDEPGRSHGRAARHAELLRACEQAEVDQLHELALDELWPSTGAWQDALRGATTDHGGLAARLLGFDGQASADSEAALAWWYFRRAFAELDRDPGLLKEVARRLDVTSLSAHPESASLLRDALTRADELMTRESAHGLRFGDVFRVGRGGVDLPSRAAMFPAHPVATDYRDVEAPVRVMLHGEPDPQGRRWVHSGGRSLRLVQLGTPVGSWSVVLYGQSSRPDSPHYSDQARLLSAKRLRSTHFEEGELMEHVVTTTTLEPVL